MVVVVPAVLVALAAKAAKPAPNDLRKNSKFARPRAATVMGKG